MAKAKTAELSEEELQKLVPSMKKKPAMTIQGVQIPKLGSLGGFLFGIIFLLITTTVIWVLLNGMYVFSDNHITVHWLDVLFGMIILNLIQGYLQIRSIMG